MGRRKNEVSTRRAAELLEANEETIRRHAARAAEGDEAARFSPGSVRKDWGGRWWIQKEEIERHLTALGGVAY